jgi:RNA polymerase sigma-70 factor, ECF subfamily
MAEPDLSEALAKGAAAWPGVKVSREALAAHLARIARGAETSLEGLHLEDLYLACACTNKDDRAILAFEGKYLHEVPSYVGQIDRSPPFIDEVGQQLREKLFVTTNDEGQPKISEYTGRGPLGAWVRVVCVRLALNLRRRPKHTVETEGERAPVLRSAAPDPEMDFLKSKYKDEFRDAFQATLAELTGDERAVLKMHYIDGLNIDQIGVAYRVHRATVARWLSHSREKIMEETKKRLEERLQMKSAEVESLIGLVRSQLDVSIYKFLKS